VSVERERERGERRERKKKKESERLVSRGLERGHEHNDGNVVECEVPWNQNLLQSSFLFVCCLLFLSRRKKN
jgi:hypothetical protein